MGMKTCTKCGETKGSDAFFKQVKGKDYLRARCKTCQNAISKAWREANPGRGAAITKAHKETQKAERPLEYLLKAAKDRTANRLRTKSNDPRGVFTVTLSDVLDAPSCPDCLSPFQPQGYDLKGRHKPHVRSLDRADSSKGYIPGNVHVLCRYCNKAKGADNLHRVQHLHAACTEGGMITCNGVQQSKPALARRIARMQKALTDVQRLSHSTNVTRSITWALDEYSTTLEKLHD